MYLPAPPPDLVGIEADIERLRVAPLLDKAAIAENLAKSALAVMVSLDQRLSMAESRQRFLDKKIDSVDLRTKKYHG